MTNKRTGVVKRISKTVVEGETVYLAVQVAEEAVGASVSTQTKEIHGKIERLLLAAGSYKAKLLMAFIRLTGRGQARDCGVFRRDRRDLCSLTTSIAT